MPRITKDPQIRRNELINAAEELILIHGYDQTSVSDIVKKVGVAQGTFYHYFKSKDDVINAIIDRIIIEIKDGVENVASKKDQNAIEKILEFFSFFNNLGQNWKKFVDYFHEERNAHLHLKFEQRVPAIILPLLNRIIKQGVDEGLFNTKYPQVAAVSFLLTISSIDHKIYGLKNNIGGTNEIADIIFDFTERLLGAKPGIFKEYALKMEGKE